MNSFFQTALNELDAVNQQDPKKIDHEGKSQGYEYVYSLWLSHWIKKLNPNASEILLLAARGQHLKRWEIPRTHFEEGKIGYLQWRKFLYQFHADETAKILAKIGYKPQQIEEVQEIILKKNLKTNPDSQCMEDALCLVFLEHQLEEFINKTAAEKMPGIIQKSWKKMSERGHELALTIVYSDKALKLIKSSLGLQ